MAGGPAPQRGASGCPGGEHGGPRAAAAQRPRGGKPRAGACGPRFPTPSARGAGAAGGGRGGGAAVGGPALSAAPPAGRKGAPSTRALHLGPTCSACRRAGSSGGRTWRGVSLEGWSRADCEAGAGSEKRSSPSRSALSQFPPAPTDPALRRHAMGTGTRGGEEKEISPALPARVRPRTLITPPKAGAMV